MNDPQNYVYFNSLQKRDAKELLEERRRHLQWKEGERVLDIGCGPGDITTEVLFPLLRTDATLVGCDISDEMITYCNQFIKNDRIRFITADIVQKDIGNILQLESFDKVFSFYCFHWISDHRQAIQNIYSLLKPDGEILLMFLTPNNPINRMTEKLKISDKWKKFMEKKQFFYESEDSPSHYHTILKDVGFRNINCYLQRKKYLFPSVKALIGLLKVTYPYMNDVPQEMRIEYEQDMIAVLKQERLVEDDEVTGGLIANYNLMIVVAQKVEK